MLLNIKFTEMMILLLFQRLRRQVNLCLHPSYEVNSVEFLRVGATFGSEGSPGLVKTIDPMGNFLIKSKLDCGAASCVLK